MWDQDGWAHASVAPAPRICSSIRGAVAAGLRCENTIMDPAIAELVIHAERSAPRFALFCPLWMYSLVFHFLYSCIFVCALREAQVKSHKVHEDREIADGLCPVFARWSRRHVLHPIILMGVCFVKKKHVVQGICFVLSVTKGNEGG